MEDATIKSNENNNNSNSNSNSNSESLYQQGQYPSVITTDDLVFELGKEVADRINKEKLLNGLLKKSKTTEAQLEQLKILPQKLEKISASNKLYEENNRKLSDELSKIRQESNDEIKKLSTNNDKLSKEKELIKQELDKLSKEKKELLDKIELLKTTPKKTVSKKTTPKKTK